MFLFKLRVDQMKEGQEPGIIDKGRRQDHVEEFPRVDKQQLEQRSRFLSNKSRDGGNLQMRGGRS